jgi:aminopeptidase YwaD
MAVDVKNKKIMVAEISPNSTQDTLNLTQNIIEECGPRLAGMPGCRDSAFLVKNELEKTCDSVNVDEFEVHPEAFIGFMKFLSVSYILALIALIIPNFGVYISAIITIIALWNGLSQFVFYRTHFDRFYKKKTGYNVYGVIEPKCPAKQQIVISGHHDAVHNFRFIDTKYQKYYSIRITLGLLPIFIALFMNLIWVVVRLSTGSDPAFASWQLYFMIGSLIFVVPLFFFVDKGKVTPGAGDNLIASALAVQIGEIFGKNSNTQEDFSLNRTRLILASFDGEESGMRGSRDFAQKHKKWLNSIPTYAFNIDSIYEVKELQFLTKDINGFEKLSKKMATECLEVATDLGYPCKLFPFTFGGGGTDAAEFARIGVETTTLLAMATEIFRDNLVYHTMDDTVENIEPEAVEATLNIAINYILRKDSQFSEN